MKLTDSRDNLTLIHGNLMIISELIMLQEEISLYKKVKNKIITLKLNTLVKISSMYSMIKRNIFLRTQRLS